MKKRFAIMTTLLGLGALAACSDKPSQAPHPDYTADVTMAQTILSIQMLNATDLSGRNIRRVASEEEVADKVFSYLDLMDSVLSYEPIGMEAETSDREEFEKKISVSLKTLDLTTENYVLYYNFTLEKEEHDEKEYRLTGLAYQGETEYVLEGTYEEEQDGDEHEQELELKMKLDDDNYVKISQEREDEESEYAFKVIRNGIEQSKVKLEIEQEEKKGTEVSLKEENPDGERKIKFSREKENDEEIIRIKIEENGKKTKAKIRVVTDPETESKLYELVFEETGEIYHKTVA